MKLLRVEISDDELLFHEYPFRGASVYPAGRVPFHELADVYLDFGMPEVRTKAGEILFLSAEHKDGLREACGRHGVPIVAREDLWEWLLEPFLDTEFTAQTRERAYQVLQAHGVDRGRCDAIRAEVGGAMVAYNLSSGLWEWVYLGLYDLLQARSGVLAGPFHRLSDRNFRKFYWDTMELAVRGWPGKA